jgi:hypothetical protein
MVHEAGNASDTALMLRPVLSWLPILFDNKTSFEGWAAAMVAYTETRAAAPASSFASAP